MAGKEVEEEEGQACISFKVQSITEISSMFIACILSMLLTLAMAMAIDTCYQLIDLKGKKKVVGLFRKKKVNFLSYSTGFLIGSNMTHLTQNT